MSDRQPEQTTAKTPPQDFDAEQAVLGSMLLEPGAVSRALSVIAPGDFYWETHELIATALVACYQRREPVDLTTVSAELRRKSQLEQVGGGTYLTTLIAQVPTAAHVLRYANIVAEKAALREIIRRSQDIASEAYTNPDDVGALLAVASERMRSLYAERTGGGGLERPEDRFEEDITTLWADLQEECSPVSSARLGISRVDELMGGLESERLVIINADTKNGKSQLLRQAMLMTARHFLADRSKRVVVGFILEEGRKPWHRKRLSWQTGIDSMKLLKRGWGASYLKAHPEAQDIIVQAESEYASLPLRLTWTIRDIRQIEATCRAIAMDEQVGLIAIDYMQLISGGEEGTHTEEHALRRRAERLQVLADELGVPIVVPSQVTQDKQTGRLDTKGARAIGHNASMVLLWQRNIENKEFQDSGYLGCLLDRNGPGFSPVEIITDRKCGRFWDADDYRRRQHEEEPHDRF